MIPLDFQLSTFRPANREGIAVHVIGSPFAKFLFDRNALW